MNFVTATIPDDIPTDSVPELSDVEYPCRVCGKESGPYGGRGRKPVTCEEHRKSKPTGNLKVSGAPDALAKQATAVLVQINGMVALASMGMSLFKTAHAISEANPTFEQQAYQALLTDQELCKLILKSGAKSAKLSLAIAYGGLGMAVLPTAVIELKEKKEARAARKAELNDESGA